MSLVAELIVRSGVIAAGEYTYKQELSFYQGKLTDEQARMLAIMCYSTTKGVVMQGDIITSLNPQSGLQPPRGWVMRGPDHTLCVVANVFCLIDNRKGSLNKILDFMQRSLAGATLDLV